jgi:hypothetical protein
MTTTSDIKMSTMMLTMTITMTMVMRTIMMMKTRTTKMTMDDNAIICS